MKWTPKYRACIAPDGEACLDRLAGLRPDLPDTSDTLKKAKRITKPQIKPELE